jgi:hypothetical protein
MNVTNIHIVVVIVVDLIKLIETFEKKKEREKWPWSLPSSFMFRSTSSRWNISTPPYTIYQSMKPLSTMQHHTNFSFA